MKNLGWFLAVVVLSTCAVGFWYAGKTKIPALEPEQVIVPITTQPSTGRFEEEHLRAHEHNAEVYVELSKRITVLEGTTATGKPSVSEQEFASISAKVKELVERQRIFEEAGKEFATKSDTWQIEKDINNIQGEVERVDRQARDNRASVVELSGVAAEHNIQLAGLKKRITRAEEKLVTLEWQVKHVPWLHAREVRAECGFYEPEQGVVPEKHPALYVDVRITGRSAEEVCRAYEQRLQ